MPGKTRVLVTAATLVLMIVARADAQPFANLKNALVDYSRAEAGPKRRVREAGDLQGFGRDADQSRGSFPPMPIRRSTAASAAVSRRRLRSKSTCPPSGTAAST